MRQTRIKQSIGMKLLKYVFFAYCVVAVVLTILHMVFEYGRATEEIQATLKVYQPLFEKTVLNNVWHLDMRQLNTTLAGIVHLPEVVGVSVHDAEGHYIARTGTVAIEEKNRQRMEVVQGPSGGVRYEAGLFYHRFDLVSDVQYGPSETLGAVYFYSDTQVAFAKVAGIFQSILLLAFLKTMVLWWIFLFFSKRILSHPLNTLMVRMAHFSETHTGKPLPDPAEGGNEIESIEQTFVEMSQQLDHTMDETRKGYAKLRIIASTVELSSSQKDIPTLLRTILKELIHSSWLDARRCVIQGGCIYLLRQGRNTPAIKVHEGLSEQTMDTCTRATQAKCLCARSARQKEILFSPEKPQADDHPDVQAGRVGYYSTPILAEGGQDVVGGITFFVQGTLTDREADKDFLSSIAHVIRHLIEREMDSEDAEQKQDYLEALMAGALDSIISIDCQGRVVAFNPAAETLFGYKAEEVLGQEIADTIVPPEFRQAHRDALARHARNTEAALPLGRRVEVPGLRADGSRLDLSVAFTSARREGGVCFTAFLQDITERKRLLKSLEKTVREAELASQFKSEFLANMSHEIRTPMNAVIGLSHLCLQTSLTLQQKDYLDKIHGSANALLRLLNDILDFSKIEAGKLAVEVAPFCLGDVLNDLSTLITVRTRDKELEVVFDIARGVPRNLMGDPTRLGQVLTNLTNNAVKFTPSGDVVLSVEQVHEAADAVTLKFTVRDTGIGMTPEQVGRLFQAFSQADGGTTRLYGGTGLGLTISKRLVELMGGTIGVESTFGVGSRFFFTLCLGLQKEATRTAMRLPEALLNKHVLVVDDNQASQAMLCTALASFSFQVTAVSTGMEGLMVLEKRRQEGAPFDLLVLDWRMPSLDGVQMFQCLTSLETPCHLPTLFMVPHTEQAEIRAQIGDVQPGGYLDKPVRISALFDAVMTLFGYGGRLPALEGQAVALRPGKAVRGARVLLVEDNDINQQVGKELLEMAHVVVEIAQDGREAVQRVAEGTFELVLMDIQMPVMDGYEATRAIRNMPDRVDLPIVAMTANVMVQDLARCWEVGMNAHVAKPIDPKKLFHVLNAWIKPRERQDVLREGAEIEEDQERAVAVSFPALPGLDTALGLAQVGDNVELYRMLLDRFVEGYGDWLTRMQDALGAGETDTAKRMAHTLKGVAGTLGAPELQSMARVLESTLRVTPALRQELGRVLDGIRAMPPAGPGERQAPTPEAVVVEPAVFLETLVRLKPHLARRRPQRCQDVLDELACMVPPSPVAQDMKALARLVNRYRMKEAQHLLDAICVRLEEEALDATI